METNTEESGRATTPMERDSSRASMDWSTKDSGGMISSMERESRDGQRELSSRGILRRE